MRVYLELRSLAQSIPIGTVQWRVFSAKPKLAPYLKRVERAGDKTTRMVA
jgi:hypothetical protein